MRLTIEKPVYGGFGLARSDGRVVLVRGALPGEVVDAEIVARKKDYAFARTAAVAAPSPHRVAPACAAYGACGGCRLQHADYPCQLAMKATARADVLRRIARVGTAAPAIRPSEPFRYRHRGRFQGGAGGVGFHAEGSHRVVPVDACPVMVDGISGLLAAFRDPAAPGVAAGFVAASDGERTVAHLPATAYDDRIAHALRERGASGAVFRDRAVGECRLAFRLGAFVYGVSPGSFFQANWRLNLELVARVEALVAGIAAGRVLDLYAGAGNFALPLSRRAAEVVAVEEGAAAFGDLRRNVAANRVANVKAVRARIERFRPSGRFDAVVVDPPRVGLSERAVRLLAGLRAARVLYVSCNPATLARDVARLSGAYRVDGVEAYDFFPQTHHVETLAVLERSQ